MKICFINTDIYGVDGISRVLSVLTNELSKKHDITVVTFEKEDCVKKDRYNLSSRVHVDFWPALYKKCYIRRAFHKLNQQLPTIRTNLMLLLVYKQNLRLSWEALRIEFPVRLLGGSTIHMRHIWKTKESTTGIRISYLKSIYLGWIDMWF